MNAAPGAAGERMRVAYVLGTSAGGTGAHVAMLARGCASRGSPVLVAGPAQAGRRFFAATGAGATAGAQTAGEAAAAAHDAGPAARVSYVLLEIADRPRPGHDLATVLRLRALLRDWAPDVVHAHGLRAGALAGLALGCRSASRCPLLVTVHNAPPAARLPSAVYGVLERIVARYADAVTWVSADLAARMRRRGATDAGRALVPAPAAQPPSEAQIAMARDSLGAQRRPVVLAVGRLAAQKGFGVLLAAAARWQDHDQVPLLAIAGDGPLAGALAEQARAARLAVSFLGRRDDVPALLAAADVIVVPSAWEGQPLVVQEALRAGKPLVVSRAGGIAELTGEDAALLVPPGDAGALARAVLSVLDDRLLADRLGRRARERAAMLPTESAAVNAVTSLYRHIARRAAGGGPPPG